MDIDQDYIIYCACMLQTDDQVR